MKYTICIFVFFASVANAFAQTETFDLTTYTPPSGWGKETKENVVTYSNVNKNKKTWCQIGIYRSTVSKGSLQPNFESEWQELIVKTYKPTTKPELVPTASENGWDAQGGVAPFTFNGSQSIAMLVTMSGFSRCTSIVILTNTEDYQAETQTFLESVTMKKMDAQQTTEQTTKEQPSSNHVSNSGFAFSTTNFDDGWISTMQEDWVQVVKGAVKVLIHYPSNSADAYNSVVLDGLKNAWNVLVAPRYSSASNFEFKPTGGWESIEFAEADMTEIATGKTVHVVLFKKNYNNGSGKYVEFITPDKQSFEQEFGAYQETMAGAGFEKMENMASYNKFAVGAADLNGTWTNNFSGMIQYVNANTGYDAGADTHSSSETFAFSGSIYHWEISVANGMVGNIKFQNAKSTGNHSLPNNWQIHFSDLEGKPKTYNAFFSCIKGARILWLEDSAYHTGYTAYGKKE